MSRYLVQHDGLYLGSSSACNLVACVRLAKRLGSGSRIVTILYVSWYSPCDPAEDRCDAGFRHQTKFWSDDYLKANGIEIDPSMVDRIIAE